MQTKHKNKPQNKRKNSSGYTLNKFTTFTVPISKTHLDNYTPALLRRKKSN